MYIYSSISAILRHIFLRLRFLEQGLLKDFTPEWEVHLKHF